MRNMANQKRVFDAHIFVFVMWLLFAVLFIAIYFYALFPKATYFGISDRPYLQDAPVDKIQKGDLVFYNKNVAEPKEGQLIVYVTKVRDGEGRAKETVKTDIFVRIEQIESTQIVIDEDGYEQEVPTTINYYVLKTPGEEGEGYVFLDDSAVLGFSFFSIPKVGYGLMYLNYNLAISLIGLAIAFLLMACMPVLLIVKRVRLNRLPSPFKEGIDLSKLNKENYYIYTELKNFFAEGNMQVEKGNDCLKVYIPVGGGRKVLFATVVHTNKTIKVLINRDFSRPDGRLDRSAFITVYGAAQLPEIKERIIKIYREFFKPDIQKIKAKYQAF